MFIFSFLFNFLVLLVFFVQMGRYLKFLNREESINQLLIHAQKQFRFYNTGYGDKDFRFTTCSGGPGLGKVTSQSAFLSIFLLV